MTPNQRAENWALTHFFKGHRSLIRAWLAGYRAGKREREKKNIEKVRKELRRIR